MYILDFNLSKKYRDSKTLQHIPYKENCSLVGTTRYASINAHLGIELSRRDDLESLVFMLVYFLKGSLPWQGVQAANKSEKNQKILDCKISYLPEMLCEGLPVEFSVLLNYVRALRFDERPDYLFIRKLFRELFVAEGYEMDYCYDWMNPLFVRATHQFIELSHCPDKVASIESKTNLNIHSMVQNVYDKFNEVSLKKIFDFLANIDLDDFHFDQLAAAGESPNDVSVIREPAAEPKKRPQFGKSQTARSQEERSHAQKSADLNSESNVILKVPFTKL